MPPLSTRSSQRQHLLVCKQRLLGRVLSLMRQPKRRKKRPPPKEEFWSLRLQRKKPNFWEKLFLEWRLSQIHSCRRYWRVHSSRNYSRITRRLLTGWTLSRDRMSSRKGSLVWWWLLLFNLEEEKLRLAITIFLKGKVWIPEVWVRGWISTWVVILLLWLNSLVLGQGEIWGQDSLSSRAIYLQLEQSFKQKEQKFRGLISTRTQIYIICSSSSSPRKYSPSY